MAAQTWEHLFRHCSRLKDQQTMLWKQLGNVTRWRAGRCWHTQISQLLSMEIGDKVVMDFLVATEVGKFPPKTDGGVKACRKWVEELQQPGSPRFLRFSFVFYLTAFQMLSCVRTRKWVAGVELHHRASQPGRGGDWGLLYSQFSE